MWGAPWGCVITAPFSAWRGPGTLHLASAGRGAQWDCDGQAWCPSSGTRARVEMQPVCVCVLPGVAHMCARGQKTREDLEKHLASVDGEAGLFHVCEKDVVNFARLTRIP